MVLTSGWSKKVGGKKSHIKGFLLLWKQLKINLPGAFFIQKFDLIGHCDNDEIFEYKQDYFIPQNFQSCKNFDYLHYCISKLIVCLTFVLQIHLEESVSVLGIQQKMDE